MSHILDTPMMNLVQCFDAKHIHVFAPAFMCMPQFSTTTM